MIEWGGAKHEHSLKETSCSEEEESQRAAEMKAPANKTVQWLGLETLLKIQSSKAILSSLLQPRKNNNDNNKMF